MAKRRNLLISEGDGWTRVGPRQRRPPKKLGRSSAAYHHGSTRRPRHYRRPKRHSILSLFPKPYLPASAASPTNPVSLPHSRAKSISPQPFSQFSGPESFFKPLPSLANLQTFKAILLQSKPFSPNITMDDGRSKRPRSFATDKANHSTVPPDTVGSRRKGRCFKCNKVGHDRVNCPGKAILCANCNGVGHEARYCTNSLTAGAKAAEVRKKKTLENLQPRGFIGEKEFPEGRPDSIEVYVPQGPDQIRDIQNLGSAVVVDARLNLCKEPDSIQAAIMAACNFDSPFSLIHMSDVRYILILPKGTDRADFIHKFGPKLENVGLVLYPWSARIDSEPVEYNFKVWLDLLHVPIHAWNRPSLVPMVAKAGLLLDHTPLESVTSLESLRVVIAVKSLLDVPNNFGLNLRMIRKVIPVRAVGWTHESTTARPPVDPTPSQLYFDSLQQRLNNQAFKRPPGNEGKKFIPVDFDVAYDTWANMPESDEKDRLEASLKGSAFWEIRRKKEILSTGTRILADLLDTSSKLGTGDFDPLALAAMLAAAFQAKQVPIGQSSNAQQGEPAATGNKGAVRKLFSADGVQVQPLAQPKPTLHVQEITDSGAGHLDQVVGGSSVVPLSQSEPLQLEFQPGDMDAMQVNLDAPLLPLKPTPGPSSSDSKSKSKTVAAKSKAVSGKKKIEQALQTVGLQRCTDFEAVTDASVTQEEDDGLRQFCGLLEQARVATDSTSGLSPDQELPIGSDEGLVCDDEGLGGDDEGLDFSYSGMEDVQMEDTELEEVSLEK